MTGGLYVSENFSCSDLKPLKELQLRVLHTRVEYC